MWTCTPEKYGQLILSQLWQFCIKLYTPDRIKDIRTVSWVPMGSTACIYTNMWLIVQSLIHTKQFQCC